MDLKQLKKEIPYQWKVQSFIWKAETATKATCVAYIDARDVMDLLDEVVGPENWEDEYETVRSLLICKLSIKVWDDRVTKCDTWTESDAEAEKWQVSDAFKRAAVKWWIGRFLYDLETKFIDIKDKKPVDENWKRIYDLTKHFNSVAPKKPVKDTSYQIPKERLDEEAKRATENFFTEEQWQKTLELYKQWKYAFTTFEDFIGTIKSKWYKITIKLASEIEKFFKEETKDLSSNL